MPVLLEAEQAASTEKRRYIQKSSVLSLSHPKVSIKPLLPSPKEDRVEVGVVGEEEVRASLELWDGG